MRWIKRINDPNIWRVYVATLILGLGYGMAISLLPLLLNAKGFDKQSIGTLAAWFAAGIVALSLPMSSLIQRFTAKVTLTASLFGYALTVGVFPFLESYHAMAAVRFFDGAFSVAIWVSCETILLARAGTSNKAFVMSLYAIAISLGYIGGPWLSWLLTPVASMNAGFVTAGLLATSAAVFTLVRLDRALPIHDAEEYGQSVAAGSNRAVDDAAMVTAGQLLWRIKNSCFATFAYGYFQVSVVLFLPLFMIESKGIAQKDTITISFYFAAGMLVFLNIAARIGDRFGHLFTMRVLGTIGGFMVLGFAFLDSYALMCIAIMIAGATLASISPVSLALQGVVVERQNYARANSIYNVFYAAGMLLGPPISSILFERYGGAMMLYHLAALWAAFVLFTLVFYRDDPAARGVVLVKPGTAAEG
jgi:MFS family permease